LLMHRRMKSLAVLALLPLATGCFTTTPDPIPLAHLPDPHVVVQSMPGLLRVWIHASKDEFPEVCWSLADSFEATAAGRALDIDRGVFDGEDCFEPYLELAEPPPVTDATLVLGDASMKLSIPLGNMFVPRAAELVPAGPWSFAPEQTVQIAITPADSVVRLGDPHVKLISGAGEEVPLYASITGGLLTFKIPASLGPQRGHFELTMAESRAMVACGDAVCQRSVWHQWRQEIEITP
jgi:hypothetical protein